MDDLISRQAAIDALRKMQTYKLFAGDDMILVDKAQVQTELMILPSVQPETNCSEIPNNSDTISRQAAIDFVGSMNMCDEISNEACKKLTSYLDELPSIQPDIIHCKDCKWYGRADKRRFYRGMDCLQKRIDTIVPDRDFCSRAERKENGH